MLGLSETRWLQSEQPRLSSGEQLLYSGLFEGGAPHTEGVALMLAPELTEHDETDIETQWEHCKKLLQDTFEEVLGKKKT